ncbi:hypothetical protein GCM10023190_26390 [Enteractinococcus fodinae]
MRPFSLMSADTVVPCWEAMRDRVSPDTTVCVPLLEEVEDEDDEVESEELELFENDRF